MSFGLRSVLRVITKGEGKVGQKTKNLGYVIHGWSLTNHSIVRKQLEIETLAFCVLSRMIGKQLVESCPRWMALLHEY